MKGYLSSLSTKLVLQKDGDHAATKNYDFTSLFVRTLISPILFLFLHVR